MYAGGQSILVGTPSGRDAGARGRRAPVDHHAVGRARAAALHRLGAGLRAGPRVDAAARAVAARPARTAARPTSASPPGPIDQALAAVPEDAEARERAAAPGAGRRLPAARGGRRARGDARGRRARSCPRLLAAADELDGRAASPCDVVCLTSPDLVFRALQARQGLGDGDDADPRRAVPAGAGRADRHRARRPPAHAALPVGGPLRADRLPRRGRLRPVRRRRRPLPPLRHRRRHDRRRRRRPALTVESGAHPHARPLEEAVVPGGRNGEVSVVPLVPAVAATRDRRGQGRLRSLRADPEEANPAHGRSRTLSRRSRRCSTAPATWTARVTAAACCWTSRAGSGPRRCAPAATPRSWRSTSASRWRTSVIPRRGGNVERGRRSGPASIMSRVGLRVLAEREDAVDSTALGPAAREEEPVFWQVGGLIERAAALLRARGAARGASSTLHVASCSTDTVVYKVLGAPAALGRYYPDLRDPRAKTAAVLRPQPLLHQHVAELQARAAVRRARPQRRDQHDRAAAPGGAMLERPAHARTARTPRTSTGWSRRWSTAAG